MNYERHAQSLGAAIQNRIGTHLMKPLTLVIGKPDGGSFWVTDGNFPADAAFYAHDPSDTDLSSTITVLRGKYKKSEVREGRAIEVKEKSGFYYLFDFPPYEDVIFMDGAEELDDELPVLLRQLTEIGTAHPVADSLQLRITEALFGTDYYSGGTTSDFSSGTVQDTSASNITAPAVGNAKGILIQVDAANGTLEYKQSADFDAILSLQQAYNAALLPSADSNRYRVAYAKWVNGATQFSYDQIWEAPELLSKGDSAWPVTLSSDRTLAANTQIVLDTLTVASGTTLTIESTAIMKVI